MKKVFLLGAMVCALGMMTACTKDNGTNGEGGNNSSGQDNGSEQTSYCNISPETKRIGAESGSFTISVRSNTNWSVSLNNSGSSSISGLSLSTYSGNGNGSITVFYDAVTTEYYYQSGTVVVSYDDSWGSWNSKGCYVYRKKQEL